VVEFSPGNIRQDVATWLERLHNQQHEGSFAFCERGSLLPSPPGDPLMPTIFAAKIAWQMGQWAHWPASRKQAIIARIKNAQNPDGLFVDSWLAKQTRISWKEWIKIALRRGSLSTYQAYYQDWHVRNIRAETRQNISTLFMLGEKPEFTPSVEVNDYDTMWNYLTGLDWSNPWGAGSHLSHQLMLTSSVAKINPDSLNFDDICKATIDFLATLHHPEDGAWYQDQATSNPMKVNGAMKIFSGLQWIDFPEQDYSRLIDLVLSEPFHSDGCHFTNGLFVLHQILKRTSTMYRRREIEARARHAATHLMRHKKQGAGFSFLENNAQIHYYTARVSLGLNVADLHGTVMYVWACAIILDILKDEFPSEAPNWKIQIP
jgi:hypothetical protein